MRRGVVRSAREGLLCAAAALLAPVGPAAAADAPPPSAEVVKPGLYRIGPTLVRLGAKGSIVVDSTGAAAYRPLLKAIQGLAKNRELPVRGLFLTAVGPEQAGNVRSFVEGGVPVIVQERALPRLAVQAKESGAARSGRFVSYGADYVLQLGDVAAEAEHVGRGRTGADSVVYFRDLRVLAVGELFTHGAPQPDCASGGSLAGWAAAITHLLWFDFDVAVPSRGAPVDKRALADFKATLEALAQRGGSRC